ncbi:MAG: sigma-70 family RNA polymerase sigma factor [Kiritimatiellae bacterium]|nr:sigma-70 family RNA polymerase sigma factor [Kiritimatiellia bacterium]
MPIPTSTTLLRDISGDPLHPRWDDFVARYRPFMLSFLERQFPFLPVDDIVQETLIALVEILPSYQYDSGRNGLFHNYLSGILLRKALRICRENEQYKKALADFAIVSQTADSGDDETEWKKQLFEIALQQFLDDPSVADRTKRIFERVAVNGESPETVARAFKMNRHAVDQTKARSLAKIRRLVAALGEVANA